MKVLTIVLVVLIIIVSIFYISSTIHKIGYVSLVVLGIYLIAMSGSASNSKSYDFIAYCFLALFVYSIIGLVEALIRIFNRDFTFEEFITKKLSSNKEKRRLEEQRQLPEPLKNKEDTEKNVYSNYKVSDLLNESVSVQGDVIESPENSSFVYNDYINLFISRSKFFDSDMEKKIYPIIRAFINDKYPIFAHVSLRDIFYWGKWEDNWQLANRVNRMHFDFVVFEYLDDDMMPMVIIEVQGEDHYTNPRTMERDQFKEKLLEKCNLKLVTIDVSENIPDDEICKTVMQRIKEEVPSRDDYNVHCPLCNAPMIIKQHNNGQDYFYGCSKWKRNKTGCSGSRSISEIPPLYDGIPMKRK